MKSNPEKKNQFKKKKMKLTKRRTYHLIIIVFQLRKMMRPPSQRTHALPREKKEVEEKEREISLEILSEEAMIVFVFSLSSLIKFY